MDFNSVASNGGSSVSNASGSGRTGGLLMDSKVNGTNGSGDFDMEVLLHKDLFAGVSANDYVYLYNFAGAADASDIKRADLTLANRNSHDTILNRLRQHHRPGQNITSVTVHLRHCGSRLLQLRHRQR